MQRNNVENQSTEFDWQNLISHYREAYVKVLERKSDCAVVIRSTIGHIVFGSVTVI
jgi:hypothetical protein